MARNIVTTLEDDIDGTAEDVRTVPFTYGKQQYVIDLGPENRAAFDAAMEPWVRHARKFRKNPRPGRARHADTRVIREWARGLGLIDPDMRTGRLPEHIISRYEKEHQA